MDAQHQWLAEQFEANRSHLQAVAYRMLGSLSEADDAVQESWLHLSRSETSGVLNLGGWLTTVVARICLDMLRSRKARREESLETSMPTSVANHEREVDPEQEALLADAVGLAMLIVLDTLNPAERVAFVLHDVFAIPFDEIARVVERSETATRQLASRARRRVHGAEAAQDSDLTRRRVVVDAFLAASRAGDFDALLALLDPEVVFRADLTAVPAGAPVEVRGAPLVARQFKGRAHGAQSALVNGDVGAVVARNGRLFLVLRLTIKEGKITAVEAIADPVDLQALRLSVLDR
jgi:RNA polymerase sigma factor (sigma-70 family)